MRLFRPMSAPALQGMRLGPEGSENPIMLQFFTWDSKHDSMSWWKHLENEIPVLAKMGFTQVWLPPPQKAMNPNGTGYDAYDLWDLGEFDQKGSVATRWGTKKELLQASAVARQHGVDILIDAVLNHKLGGDRVESFPAVPVDPDNRLKDTGKVRDIDGYTAFDFSGRAGKHSTFRWTYEHFTGVDWDNRTRTKSIFRIASKKHAGWSKYVDKERGNFDYLLGADIDHRHLDVQQDLLDWGQWVVETTGASGFRIDAVKHIDRRFLLEFVTRTREKVPRMFAVYECWCEDLARVLWYVRAFKGQGAFFDVPLHSQFHRASKAGAQYDLRKILDGTLVKARPGDAVTFVDNHDTVPGRTLSSWVDKTFKLQAYALILLREGGHPCVFYGDLYPDAKRHNDETASSAVPAISIPETLKLLIEARKKFGYGLTINYFKDRNCIGFVRLGTRERPGCVVMISNRDRVKNASPHIMRMNVGRNHGNAIYETFIGEQEEVAIDGDGWGTFTCMPSRVHVWARRER